jgi:hypothetical protein
MNAKPIQPPDSTPIREFLKLVDPNTLARRGQARKAK